MSLTSNSYFIFSGTKQVGRHPIEDRSALPKPVLVLPPGVRPLGPWQIEPTSPGRYKLRALGAPTAEDRGLVWAFLMGEDRDYDWLITSRGDDYYTVEKGRGVGWVATCEEEHNGTQIAVRPLISAERDDQLFRFIPADRYENTD
ncbi:hypothetical protein APHAL10511_006913 [Amanita phalloides]|nr:hypothetical protein APHAL10511_006913 [Amanita phalloides]